MSKRALAAAALSAGGRDPSSCSPPGRQSVDRVALPELGVVTEHQTTLVRNRRHILLLGGAIGAAALSVLGLSMRASAGGSSPTSVKSGVGTIHMIPPTSISSLAQAAPASIGSLAQAAPAPDCSLSATAVLQTPASPQQRERINNFPPAQPPATNATPMSQATAIQAARFPRDNGTPDRSARQSAPVNATEMSYATLVNQSQRSLSADPDISGQRCVWLVTVHAPFAIKTPPGAPARVVQVYNVVLDVGTGHHIATIAGGDLSR